MRNGIYRSWFKAAAAQGGSAIIFVDGRVMSCDPTHAFLGQYSVVNGHFHAEVQGKRHTSIPNMASMSELSEFRVICDGSATEETASIRCSIVEQPGQTVSIDMVWIGEI